MLDRCLFAGPIRTKHASACTRSLRLMKRGPVYERFARDGDVCAGRSKSGAAAKRNW